jgi:hypothetical protein
VAQGKRVGEPQAGAAGKRRRSGGPEAAFDELVSYCSRRRLQPLLCLHCLHPQTCSRSNSSRKPCRPLRLACLPARPFVGAACTCRVRAGGQPGGARV